MRTSGSGAANGFAGPAVTPASSPNYSPQSQLATRRLRGEVLGRPLSRRERQCLAHAAHGLTDEAIGGELGISGASTVRNHFTVAYAKLGVTSRIEAFIALGWLTPPAIEAAA